jgi:hypothetical protein
MTKFLAIANDLRPMAVASAQRAKPPVAQMSTCLRG